MGQYQQWLLAQEIDRRLKAEIETLETELFYLQDRITILEQSVPVTENVILQALMAHLQGPISPRQQSEARPSDQEKSAGEGWPGQNDLSRMETPRMQGEEGMVPYLPGTYSQAEKAKDMLAFFDRSAQTDPQLSAWLQRERKKIAASGGEHVVDEETRRLNESIQRWFTRWHRQIASIAQPEEVEHEQ